MADLDNHHYKLQESLDELIRVRQLVSSKDSIIKGLLQLVTMIIQVGHGKAMAPFQDGQRIIGIAIQPIKVITRSCKGTFFFLQTKISSQTPNRQ